MVTITRPALPGRPVAVQVWGDYACFTRPEFGAEKVSYPVMTPTAARGLLEAIFWKPEFEWRIVAIDVLRPVQWARVFRNGIGARQTVTAARKWIVNGGGYDAAVDRQQFNTLLLRDVAYVVHAEPRVVRGGDDPAKYRDQFRRRVNRGQFLVAPYLGCREFVAYFSEPDGTEPIGASFDPGSLPHHFHRNDDYDPTANGAITSIEWLNTKVVGGRLLVEGET